MGSKSKKSKSQPKPKSVSPAPMTPVQSPPQAKKEEGPACKVCFQTIPSQEDCFRCQKCEKVAHKVCYGLRQPTEKSQKIIQKQCDQCLANKKQTKCQICGNQGLLRAISNDDDHMVHISCALLNYTTIQIVSFRQMRFEELKDKINKRKKMKMAASKCSICKKIGGLGAPLAKCLLCQQYAHVYCYKYAKHLHGTGWQQFFTMPDKIDFTQRDTKSLAKLDNYYRVLGYTQKMSPTDSVQVLCPYHSIEDIYNYCYCSDQNKQKLNEKEAELISCESCKRWIHLECSGLANTLEGFPKCNHCIQENIFKQNWSWKRTIEQLVNYQTDTKNKQSGVKNKLKLIHHLPFPFSRKIFENISKSKEQILKFELTNYFESFLEKVQSNPNNIREICEHANLINLMYAISLHPEPVQNLEKIHQEVKQSAILNYFGKAKILSKTQKQQILAIFTDKIMKTNVKVENQSRSGQSIKPSNSLGKKVQKKESSQQLLIKAKQKVEAFMAKNQKQVDKKNYAIFLQQQLKNLQPYFRAIADKENVKMKQLGKQNSLFCLLIEHTPPKENIVEAIEIYKYLEEYRKSESLSIDESMYYRTKKFLRKLQEPQRIQFKSLFQPLIQRNNVRRKGVDRSNFVNRCLEKIRIKNEQKHLEIQKMQSIAVNNNILLLNNPTMIDIVQNEYYYRILKQKCLGAIRKQSLKPGQIEQLLPQIHQLVTKGYHFLRKNQIYDLKRFPMKFQFYNRIIAKYRQACPQAPIENIQDSNQMRDQNDQRVDIFQQVRNIFEGQKIINLVPQDLFREFSQLYENGVHFHDYEKQVLLTGLESVLSAFNDHIEQRSFRVLKPEDLRRLNNVLKCFSLNQKFPKYQKEWNNYKQWVKPLAQLKINECLEDEQQNQRLQIVVEQMLETKDNLSINLNQEVKKLNTVKLWAKLSKKYFQIFCLKRRRRPTINAVQQFKELLMVSKYPSNIVFKKINSLEIEAKNMNKNINRFLERPKIVQQEICQEQAIYYSKITIQYAHSLLDTLKSCSLDVSSEMEQLQAFIKDFNKISMQQFQKALQSKNLSLILEQKKKLMESPIRSDDQTIYSRMIRAIYSLKALEFTPPIKKTQFNNMLAYGGVNVTNLLKNVSKAQRLARAYKVVQKAQKQILLSPNLRDQKKLLQPSDAKRILDDLEADPQQKSKVEKWFETVRLCKQKTLRMKNGKMQTFDQLRKRQQQLFRIPVNSKEIVNEHSIMKRQLDQIVGRIHGPNFAAFIQQHSSVGQFQNICRRYKNNGIKDQKMQLFARDFQQYKQIRRLKEGYKPQNYRNFSTKCIFNPELGKMSQIRQFRKEYFDAIHHYCSNQQRSFSPELNNVLIEQGVWIQKTMKINNKHTKSLIQKLVQLCKKKAQNFELDPESDQLSDDQQLDDEESQNGESNFEEQGFDQDEFQEEQCEDMSKEDNGRQGRSKKRPPPFVNLDDQS